MKKFTRLLNLLLIALSIILLLSCGSNQKPTNKIAYGEATKELVAMVDKNPELKSLLTESIEKARQINPDTISNPAQSLEQYYDFVSRTETCMPWEILKHAPRNTPFYNIFQSFCAFYFVVDQPLSELEGKGYFNPSLQYAEPFASWLPKFNKSWQKFLDSYRSWNEEAYQIALGDSAFGLPNGWYEDPSHWKTFNQFFARHLSSPAARPIASPDDNSIVASYADSEPQGVWAIDGNSELVDDEGIAVKSATLKSIVKLLGEESQYKNAFANGTFTHSFLNVNDYHRYHFPMGGTVKEVRIIQGINPTGGSLSWDKDQNRYSFTPSSVGWQMLETRGCVILETEEFGLVAILPIGMAAVGSVNFENTVKAGVKVKKGDPLGYFLFGGSDFIMVFQDKVQFTLDAPKQADNKSYKHILMGERLGKLVKK